MKISIKNGAILIITGLSGLFITFWTSFGDCFKGECNEEAYSLLALVSLVTTIIGAIVLLTSAILQTKRKSLRKSWLIVIISLYIITAFGVFYYLLGGNRLFEASSFQNKFKTPLFYVSYLPDDYTERFTTYSTDEKSDLHGPGSFAVTQFGKPQIDGNGDTYHQSFLLKQGDSLNDAADLLEFCLKSTNCDVIDGKNIKNIYCQQTNRQLCTVQLEGTYISISSDNNLTREDSIAILDSLVKK